MEEQAQDTGDFDHNAAIANYQRLITELPPLNRQLLLYILDLLAVFASKSDLNRMNSANLAAIFQPGLLSHPAHDMKPQEYRLSQDVLIFLIENQDSFLIGMSGTAADEKTVKEVQSGPPPRKSQSPSTPRISQGGLGRSASNASAGADSLRKFGGIRRNVSVSSKNSKTSTNIPSPASPAPGSPHAGNNSGAGVQRSNTLPSKKSPAIPSRFSRPNDSPISTPTARSSGGHLTPKPRATSPSSRLGQSTEGPTSSNASSMTPTLDASSSLTTVNESTASNQNKKRHSSNEKLSVQPPTPGFGSQISPGTPSKERKVSNLFAKSPTSDGEHRDSRLPNKLRKKRIPDSSNASAQSSTQSLHGAPDSPANQTFYTPLPTPVASAQTRNDPLASMPPVFNNTGATPVSELPPQAGEETYQANNGLPQDQQPPNSGRSLKPSQSPTLSVHSRTSITDFSEATSEVDHTDDSTVKKMEKKRRWRLSSSAHKNGDSRTTLSASSQLGSNPVAENSNTSIGSSSKPPKSITRSLQQLGTDNSASLHVQGSSNDSTPSKDKETGKDKDPSQETSEKKGPIGWFKAKVAQVKEERKEREAEKERAKSPPRRTNEQTGSKHSVSAIAQETPRRGRSAGSEETTGEQSAVRAPGES